MATTTKYTTSVTAPTLDNYEAQQLKSYEAQEDKVNETYDAKQEADIAALQKAYEQSLLEYNAALAKIPGTYQKQANELSAEAERQKAAFNEYASARGVNSGAGSQAQLAFSNQYQQDLTTIRTNQANAVADAELEISKLKAGYQADVAAAVKENDYERAAALLSEYQKAAQSVVDVAQAQADELYRAYQSQMSNQQYMAEWERAQEEAGYERAVERAETLAAYGDFSGYLELGYSQAEVDAMKAYWDQLVASSSGGSYSSGSGSGSSGDDSDSLDLSDFLSGGTSTSASTGTTADYIATSSPYSSATTNAGMMSTGTTNPLTVTTGLLNTSGSTSTKTTSASTGTTGSTSTKTGASTTTSSTSSTLGSYATSLLKKLQNNKTNGASTQSLTNSLTSAYKYGNITAAERTAIAKKLGISL